MTKRTWIRNIALITVGALVGMGLAFTSPAGAEMRSALASAWNQVRPKADKRYVKIKDRKKIVRSAYTTGASAAVTGTIEPMTTTINAPSKGFIIVDGHGTYNITAATPLLHCGISVDGDGSWTGNDAISGSIIAPAGPISCDNSARIPVSKGAHTVAYQVHNDGSGTAVFRGGSVAVLFVPFGATGQIGKPVRPHGTTVGDLNK